MYEILKATATLERLDNRKPMVLKEKLVMQILSPKAILRKELADEDVMENYSRVKVVEIMRSCVELMETRRYDDIPALLAKADPLLDQAPQSDKIKQLRDDIT
jgi:hypothetical protein